MRASVINRFAKNDRSVSGRRRIAVLAATTVLAGGVQVIAADTSWACGDARFGTSRVVDPTGPNKPTVPNADFRTPDSRGIVADGSWTEFTVGVTNFTGADVARTGPSFALASATQGVSLRVKDLRVEVNQDGNWKPLKLDQGCIGIEADTGSLTQPVANGRAANYAFRVSLSSAAPKDLNALTVVTDATNDKSTLEYWGNRTVKVTHPKTEPAKPAPAKPAPAKSAPAKSAAAVPAGEKAPATNTPAEKVPAEKPAAAPATTAPAGTPELAHTGASSTNAFLALSSAALLALGAGVLIAVRRLRPQR
ncbi:hypothetical protein ABT247_06440 [Kitasatospora sp. NPDC001539]|uniref:hypothetical protein n=1 Tax=Kitasatospora sp. NPDC001539 TaxID=3154384 RepID=UPI00331AF6F1